MSPTTAKGGSHLNIGRRTNSVCVIVRLPMISCEGRRDRAFGVCRNHSRRQPDIAERTCRSCKVCIITLTPVLYRTQPLPPLRPWSWQINHSILQPCHRHRGNPAPSS